MPINSTVSWKVGAFCRERTKRIGTYRYWRALLQHSAIWRKDEILNFQLEQLQRANIEQRFLDETSECSKSGWRYRGALTSKDNLQSNCEVRTRRFPRIERLSSTGGSTGRPLTFRQPLAAIQAEQAFIDRIWALVGFAATARVAVLRGTILPAARIRVGRRLYLSSYVHSNEDLKGHLLCMHAYDADYLHCFPSLAARLASAALVMPLSKRPRLKAVLCGSEATYPHQRQLFREAFGARTLSWYGQSEQVALAVEHPDGGFFFLPQYSALMFAPRADENLETVATGWLNEAFCLAAYATGDLVKSVNEAESPGVAAWGLYARDIIGREQEQVVLADGSVVPSKHLIFNIQGELWQGVDAFHLVQQRDGELIVQLKIRAEEIRTESLKKFGNALKTRHRDLLEINLEAVDALRLSTTPSGKARYFSNCNDLDADVNDKSH